MKLFCLLFAFYTIGISIAPCNDVHGHAEKAAVTVAEAQEHHQEDSDMCSPFCICACCQTVASEATFFHSAISVQTDKSDFNATSDSYISSPSYSIWQPPKLG